MITFHVHAVPVPQPRQRHRIAGTGSKQWVQNYTPTKHPVNQFKASVQLAAKQAYSGPLLEGPLYVNATFILPRPKSLTKKRSDNPRVWHARKPDCENICKSFLDALTQIIWVDDSQVCRLMLTKFYAAGDEPPGVKVEIGVLE